MVDVVIGAAIGFAVKAHLRLRRLPREKNVTGYTARNFSSPFCGAVLCGSIAPIPVLGIPSPLQRTEMLRVFCVSLPPSFADRLSVRGKLLSALFSNKLRIGMPIRSLLLAYPISVLSIILDGPFPKACGLVFSSRGQPPRLQHIRISAPVISSVCHSAFCTPPTKAVMAVTINVKFFPTFTTLRAPFCTNHAGHITVSRPCC